MKYMRARTPSGTRVHVITDDSYFNGYKHTKALCGISNYFGVYESNDGYSPCHSCMMKLGVNTLDFIDRQDQIPEEESTVEEDRPRFLWYQEQILQEIERIPRHMYTDTGWMGSIQYSIGRQGVGLAEVINIITKDRG